MFHLIEFSDFVHSGKTLILALEKREWIYEFNYKIKEPTSHANLIDFAVVDWSDINELKELQAEAYRHAITTLKIIFMKIMFY